MSASVATLPIAANKPQRAASTEPRLWPAVVVVLAYWIVWALVAAFSSNPFAKFMTLFFGPMLLAAAILGWWLFFSRLPWINRFWGVGCQLLLAVVAYLLAHASVNWMGLLMYATPVALTGAVVWLVVTRGAKTLVGWLGLPAIAALAFGYADLIRIDGITGNLDAERSWRWTTTAEERFLASQKPAAAPAESAPEATAPPALSPLVASAGDWPEFRGPNRDGHVRGVTIETDWQKNPPREVWRRLVGPGWSSFAVIGNVAYTQEQRGPSEAVVCFDVNTGREHWSHLDTARFEEIVAGAGPRATPTFHNGKLYALGGRGTLNCLDAATGKPFWSRDILKDAGREKPPEWGIASSPLIVQGLAIVFAGADPPNKDNPKPVKSVLAYDAESGDLKWFGGKGIHSYSSPQLATIAGALQVVIEDDHGLEAFDPASGQPLWNYEWLIKDMFRVCQPVVFDGQRVLVCTGMGGGTRQVTIAKEGEQWRATEDWASKDLEPYFNDFVLLGGYLYGFDGPIFTCLDLSTGKKQWKKGRYGHGQVLLVGDAGLALIISDKGELVLAELTPKTLTERGRIQALKGKTWNHPVLTASGKLLVRNGEEMACYDLSVRP